MEPIVKDVGMIILTSSFIRLDNPRLDLECLSLSNADRTREPSLFLDSRKPMVIDESTKKVEEENRVVDSDEDP